VERKLKKPKIYELKCACGRKVYNVTYNKFEELQNERGICVASSLKVNDVEIGRDDCLKSFSKVEVNLENDRKLCQA